MIPWCRDSCCTLEIEGEFTGPKSYQSAQPTTARPKSGQLQQWLIQQKFKYMGVIRYNIKHQAHVHVFKKRRLQIKPGSGLHV